MFLIPVKQVKQIQMHDKQNGVPAILCREIKNNNNKKL